jgi:hypothetical protein
MGKKIGRPIKAEMTEASEEIILEALAEGLTWDEICALPDMPSWRMVCKYRRDNEAFGINCKRARADYAEKEFDRIKVLADKCNSGNVDSTRVKLSALQWRIPRMNRDYADKTLTENSTTVSVTMTKQIDVSSLDVDEMLALEKALVKTIEHDPEE